jgi:hypothetical protein
MARSIDEYAHVVTYFTLDLDYITFEMLHSSLLDFTDMLSVEY